MTWGGLSRRSVAETEARTLPNRETSPHPPPEKSKTLSNFPDQWESEMSKTAVDRLSRVIQIRTSRIVD
jgi:hypothetical protein